MTEMASGGLGEHEHAASDDGGKTVTPKVVAGRVQAGHSDFATVQDAVDYAGAEGYKQVDVPPGTYKESLLIDVNGLHVHGIGSPNATVIRSGSLNFEKGDAVTVSGNHVTVSNLSAQTGAFDTGADALKTSGIAQGSAFLNCRVKQAADFSFYTDGTAVRFLNCIEESGLEGGGGLFDANSGNCLIDASRLLTGSMSNNGASSNTIGTT